LHSVVLEIKYAIDGRTVPYFVQNGRMTVSWTRVTLHMGQAV